jgi:hypothetical protein
LLKSSAEEKVRSIQETLENKKKVKVLRWFDAFFWTEIILISLKNQIIDIFLISVSMCLKARNWRWLA